MTKPEFTIVDFLGAALPVVAILYPRMRHTWKWELGTRTRTRARHWETGVLAWMVCLWFYIGFNMLAWLGRLIVPSTFGGWLALIITLPFCVITIRNAEKERTQYLREFNESKRRRRSR